MDDGRIILKEFTEDTGLTNEQLAEKCVRGDSVIEKEVAMSMYEGRVESDRVQLRKDALEDLETVMKEFEKARSETIIKSGDSEQIRDVLTWQR